MRYLIIAIAMLLSAAIPAHAQISVGIRSHDVSLSFHVSSYPRMVAIPGYPVYYDPRASSNYFFYDGLYWVFDDDNWYSSAWYDGPWDLVDPEYVPLFVLRVPVRYYRHRPAYFSGWSLNFAPRWGEHWGHDWEQHRRGWDRWDRHSTPHAAPLPRYQARYSGSRYPRAADQQYSIQSRSYRYHPREEITRQYFQQRAATSGARAGTPPPVQTPQTRVRQQQGQARQPTRAREQVQPPQRTRPTEPARSQPQTRAREQTHTPQRMRAGEPAQSQQQTRASEQVQTQPRTHASEPAQSQQRSRASEQAQGRQPAPMQQAPARPPQQQQQAPRGSDQGQQRGQRAAAPQAKGPSNQQQQPPKKEKDDKKDGGG